MRKLFKSMCMLSALALTVMGCSSNDDTNPVITNGPKDVAIRIVRPTTYAVEGSAVGEAPDLNDVAIYFVGSGNVLMRGTMNSAEITTGNKVFANVPGGAEKVIVVGNPAALASPTLPTTLPTTEATLMASLFEQSKQTHHKTAINLLGTGEITVSGTAFAASVEVGAAISRLEIGEVKTKDDATIQLSEFTLAGIFINNTYLKLGMDYTTKPTDAADIINYGPEDASVYIDNTFKAPRLCDVGIATEAGTSFKPTGENQFWAYFIMPPTAAAGGTVIAGTGTDAKPAVPHIILHIKDAKATDGAYVFAENTFVTVTKFKDTSSADVTAFAPGKVYKLSKAIEFGGEHLSEKPETPTSADLTVTVSVKAWEEASVTPEL
ncbi:MAG: hypothetical protein EOM31_02640 [Bacteroidia bacterium]|nr:hypothetical protein [Bacteroidia bacterium]